MEKGAEQTQRLSSARAGALAVCVLCDSFDLGDQEPSGSNPAPAPASLPGGAVRIHSLEIIINYLFEQKGSALLNSTEQQRWVWAAGPVVLLENHRWISSPGWEQAGSSLLREARSR